MLAVPLGLEQSTFDRMDRHGDAAVCPALVAWPIVIGNGSKWLARSAAWRSFGASSFPSAFLMLIFQADAALMEIMFDAILHSRHFLLRY